MSGLLPLSTYNLAVNPFEPVPAIDDEFPVTIRITLAAVDPESVDEAKQPSTLRILKKSIFADEDEYDESEDDELDSEGSEEEEEEEQEEVKSKKSSPKNSPKKSPKKDSPKKETKEEEESDDELDAEDDSDSDVEDDVEEYVVCTLGPGVQYQQTLDLTITPDEEVYFVATGSYAIHLTGNYIEHPYDGSSSEEDYSDEDEDDLDSDEYDLTPDEDEVLSGEEAYGIDDLEDVEDVEGKIEEIIEEGKKKSKKANKREAEEEKIVEEPTTKKSKKNKEAKKVEFTEKLEQGPSGSTIVNKKDEKKEAGAKKFPTKTLIGGVTIEDRSVGKGPACKNGQKVGVRYIGKLTNGKVFDKNTSGKPFVFSLGKGEVIKGWDVGVAGMSVGGERRISIPAPMAYGKQKLPGIPANSQLTFDVKLVSIK